MTNSAPLFTFDNSYERDLPELVAKSLPVQVPAPELVVANQALATELGLDPDVLDIAESISLLAGNLLPVEGEPVAMAYAGHQFGGYSPRLGDGRAVLLGELVAPNGQRVDVHLKGSGRTPFSRGGDGKAALGPMLREFLFAEAMHSLGIATNRALAVVVTGEPVRRETELPGAILTRVAASHIRVGTFEYTARLQDETVLPRLADYTLERHYPHLLELGDKRYVRFLESVLERQARLIADWLLVGFIHGVLNTDNVLISGESIDFGPCAFMDRYDPATVFSSIDRQGRYAFANQPGITQWNLARFAETLLPLIDTDEDVAVAAATELLERFPIRVRELWLGDMFAKLGIADGSDQGADAELVDEYLSLLQSNQIDYTTSFRALAASLRDADPDAGAHAALAPVFGDSAQVTEWVARWRARLASDSRSLSEIADGMDALNPLYIPRNHLVDHALEAATSGDMAPFHRLLLAVTSPYEHQDGLDDLTQPASTEFNDGFKTFCGT